MLKEKGRFFELPIINCKVKKIIYDGLLRIVFNDEDESFLDLHGEFKVERFSQINRFSPASKDTLVFFYDLFADGVEIEDAKADKNGWLFLKFSNGAELVVEDGPFENWHFTIIFKQKNKGNLYVHGGVGRTTF